MIKTSIIKIIMCQIFVPVILAQMWCSPPKTHVLHLTSRCTRLELQFAYTFKEESHNIRPFKRVWYLYSPLDLLRSSYLWPSVLQGGINIAQMGVTRKVVVGKKRCNKYRLAWLKTDYLIQKIRNVAIINYCIISIYF